MSFVEPSSYQVKTLRGLCSVDITGKVNDSTAKTLIGALVIDDFDPKNEEQVVKIGESLPDKYGETFTSLLDANPDTTNAELVRNLLIAMGAKDTRTVGVEEVVQKLLSEACKVADEELGKVDDDSVDDVGLGSDVLLHISPANLTLAQMFKGNAFPHESGKGVVIPIAGANRAKRIAYGSGLVSVLSKDDKYKGKVSLIQ